MASVSPDIGVPHFLLPPTASRPPPVGRKIDGENRIWARRASGASRVTRRGVLRSSSRRYPLNIVSNILKRSSAWTAWGMWAGISTS